MRSSFGSFRAPIFQAFVSLFSGQRWWGETCGDHRCRARFGECPCRNSFWAGGCSCDCRGGGLSAKQGTQGPVQILLAGQISRGIFSFFSASRIPMSAGSWDCRRCRGRCRSTEKDVSIASTVISGPADSPAWNQAVHAHGFPRRGPYHSAEKSRAGPLSFVAADPKSTIFLKRQAARPGSTIRAQWRPLPDPRIGAHGVPNPRPAGAVPRFSKLLLATSRMAIEFVALRILATNLHKRRIEQSDFRVRRRAGLISAFGK